MDSLRVVNGSKVVVMGTLERRELGGFAEAAEIFGDGVFIAGRHRNWVGAANLAGLVTELSLHLQFEVVHFGEDLVVNLFEQRRIAGEALGI